eukprot:CAMPEP_0177710606 /NCGR_PEP_ID=MMETSP0484_2-20121128/11424_1 /TAXON_ID=354590 /ORGANISM="Rhodomonas lens, Strain RHODO" /LENGTH=461 /DNA_ID=CAMNT_0019222297 /DNA_START=45 /DNA_END=1430 /DNA_ORIENTATION=-
MLAASEVSGFAAGPPLAVPSIRLRGDSFFGAKAAQPKGPWHTSSTRMPLEGRTRSRLLCLKMEDEKPKTYTGQNEDLVDIRAEEVTSTRERMLNTISGIVKGLQPEDKGPKKVAIVGSGNWACAIACIVGNNCKRHKQLEDNVNMWVFEEEVDGRKLTEIINTEHENTKYLPGIKLPENIIAVPDVGEAVKDADVLIFCLPHQFLDKVCGQVKGKHADECIAVSLIKAVEFDDTGVVLISDMIRKQLNMDVSVLMGANLAGEVAKGSFCETTIGYRVKRNGELLKLVFNDPLFRVGMAQDVDGVEVCGALKNVVALGAGFCDGMGLGQNSKGAIIRIGLGEMVAFAQTHFPGVRDSTFFESCGIADLVVTCYGGRNRQCAEAFVKADGAKTFEDIEKELLNGQKLQGTLTALEVFRILERDGQLEEYPLFTAIYRIAFEGAPPESMIAAVSCIENECSALL